MKEIIKRYFSNILKLSFVIVLFNGCNNEPSPEFTNAMKQSNVTLEQVCKGSTNSGDCNFYTPMIMDINNGVKFKEFELACSRVNGTISFGYENDPYYHANETKDQHCRKIRIPYFKEQYAFKSGKLIDDVKKYENVLSDREKQGLKQKKLEVVTNIYKKCKDAGYTDQQIENVNYECKNLEELKPYMSSNTYAGIKLGEPIEKYNFLKKQQTNLYDYDGVLYANTDNPNMKIYVLTRFGLTDTIVVKLISKQGENVVLDKLKSKYQLLKNISYSESYEVFPKVNKGYTIFRNGEDNIAHIKDSYFDMENGVYKGDIYIDTIIYSSSTYNVINQLREESKDTSKNRQNNTEKSLINGL